MRSIGVVIVTFNSSQYILNCLKSLLESNYFINSKNIIIVDNNSSDETIELVLKKYTDIKIVRNNKNLGYAKAVNIGMSFFNEELCLICNPDIEFKKDALIRLIELFKDKNVAVAGGQQIYANKKWQRSYGEMPGIKDACFNLFFVSTIKNMFKKIIFERFNLATVKKITGYLDGAALLVRRDLFEKLEGFDEDYFFYAEEADFQFRIKKRNKNYKIMFTSKANFVHIRGGSSTKINQKTTYFQKLLVKAKLTFVKKNRSSKYIKTYIFFEYLHCMKMYYLYSVLSLFQNKRSDLISKQIFFFNYSNIWKNYLLENR